MIKRKNFIRFNNNLKEKNFKITIIKELAERCLRFKWIKEQHKNLSRVIAPCAFCYHYKNETISCDLCTINKCICDNDGKSGLVGYIFSKYGNVFLKDIGVSEYNLIRKALTELKANGVLSKDLLLKIRKTTIHP